MADTEIKAARSGWYWTLSQRLAIHTAPPDERGCTIWTASLDKDGYGRLRWGRKLLRANRLAWIAVNGPIPDDLCVCHKCDVRACVNVAHFFLATNVENTHDRHIKGRSSHTHGEKHGNAKLTAAQVLAIRADTRPQKEIAADYGVDRSHISDIKNRHRWAHI